MISQAQHILEKLRKEIQVCQTSASFQIDEGIRVPFFSPVHSIGNAGFLPTGIHEFLNSTKEDAAATCGFIAALLSRQMKKGGICVWISLSGTLFPAALPAFGVDADRVIFVDIKKEKDALWVMEEALKCEQLSAVVGEIKNIDLTASRRLQLAVERSRINGFLLRYATHKLNPIASVSKWHITSAGSNMENGMPGVGFPKWNVELLKIRNGKTGSWKIEFAEGRFKAIPQDAADHEQMLKAV
jgi:protein ImuA